MAQVARSPQLEAQAQSCVSLLASLEAELALTAAHALSSASPLALTATHAFSSPGNTPASLFTPAPPSLPTSTSGPSTKAISAAKAPTDAFTPAAVKGPNGPFSPFAEAPVTPGSVLSPPISASASYESAGDSTEATATTQSKDFLATGVLTTGKSQVAPGQALLTAEGVEAVQCGVKEGSASPERGGVVSKCACSVSKTEAEYGFRASAVACGAPGTPGFRLYFRTQAGALASPWHTVPLFAEKGLLHMVCEIPRNTRAKFEVSTSEFGNPIKQDTKKGKLRFYGIDMKWNYGMFPQTWEDPSHASEDCGGFVGDNDPVDVVEIGDHSPLTGEMYAVKPVAALAMIDEGELDWKVVAVSAKDPRCELVDDVSDLEVHFPGELSAIREWFRTYKTHEGKPLNAFELNEEFVGWGYTMDVIAQTHGFWKNLVRNSHGGGKGEGKGGVAVGDVPLISGCFAHEVTSAVTSEGCYSDMGSREPSWEEEMEGCCVNACGARDTAMLGA